MPEPHRLERFTQRRPVLAGVLSLTGLTVVVAGIGWASVTDVSLPLIVPVTETLLLGSLLYLVYQQHRRDRLAAQQRNATETTRLPLTVWEATHGPADQRIGDAERDVVLERLRDRYSTGHLAPAEFDERSQQAVQARTRAELAATLRDLP